MNCRNRKTASLANSRDFLLRDQIEDITAKRRDFDRLENAIAVTAHA